jgi:hypothetical protein
MTTQYRLPNSRGRRGIRAGVVLTVSVFGGALLAAGCDPGLILTQPNAAAAREAGATSSPQLLAEVRLHFDPLRAAFDAAIAEVPASRVATDGLALASEQPITLTGEHLAVTGVSCGGCGDGKGGTHVISVTLAPKVLLADVAIESPRCTSGCTYQSHSPRVLHPPQVLKPANSFTVQVVVYVPEPKPPATPPPFDVRFNVVGIPVDVTMCLVEVRLVSDPRMVISIDGDRTIANPIWTDSNCDKTPEKNEPVAYVKDTKVQAIARVNVKVRPRLDEPLTADVTAKDAAYGIEFAFRNLVIPANLPDDGRVLELPLTGANQKLKNQVHVIDQLAPRWSFKLTDQPNVPPKQFAASTHLVYVTFGLPTTAPLYLTLLDHTTRNAQGETTNEAQVVSKIWSEFSDREVKKRDLNVITGKVTATGPQLHYWAHETAGCKPSGACIVPLPSPHVDCHGDGTTATSTLELLTQRDGQCTSWAWHLKDALATQGIASEHIGISYGGVYPNNVLFLVNNWDLGSPATPCRPGTSWTRSYDKMGDKTGAPGQGNENPPGTFANHFLVRYKGKYYDPSYGGQPFDNLPKWENASIYGYWDTNDNCVKLDTKDDMLSELKEYRPPR